MDLRDTLCRFDVLRFPLIVFVVYIHAFDIAAISQSPGYVGWLEESAVFFRILISQSICRVSVPVFFFISGFLFFKSYEPSVEGYLTKLKSRWRSLVVPFLFFSAANYLFFGLLQSIPFTAVYFSGKVPLVIGWEWWQVPEKVLGFQGAPLAYQFWFVRDLILLVFLSPFVYFFLKKADVVFVMGLLCWWVSGVFGDVIPSAESVFFFVAGAFATLRRFDLNVVDRFGVLVGWIFLVLVVLDVVWYGSEYGRIFHKIAVLFGVAYSFFVAGVLKAESPLRCLLVRLGGSSFFVFAVHEPILTIVRKLAQKLIQPVSAFEGLILYIFIPVFVIALSLLIYFFFRRFLPGALAAVSGGRS